MKSDNAYITSKMTGSFLETTYIQNVNKSWAEDMFFFIAVNDVNIFWFKKQWWKKLKRVCYRFV